MCSNWAALIVVVPKGDKLIHICRDYKVSVNPYVRQRSYRSVNCWVGWVVNIQYSYSFVMHM